MTRTLLVSTLAALLGCGAAPPPTATGAATVEAAADRFPLDATLPWDPEVRRGVLPNGLTYFIEVKDHPKGRAELRLAVNVGSIVEDDDQLGLAHFVEHMAFNGSEHFSGNQLIDAMERFGMSFGAHLNAYTSFDETVYQLHIPTERDLLDTGLLVLRDWAGGLQFDPKEVEKERGVVLDEWRLTRGAGGRISDKLVPLEFKGSRYAARLPIGTETSLRGFTRDQALRFYQDWYRPDLMAVVVVGDFDPEVVEAQVKAKFSDLSVKNGARKRRIYDIPPHPETLYGIFTDPEIGRTQVSMKKIVEDQKPTTVGGYRVMQVRALALAILNERLYALSQGASPAFRSAYVYQARNSPRYSTQGIGSNPLEGRTEPAFEAALTALRRAQKFGFLDSELARTKRSQLTFFDRVYEERRTETSGDAADELVRHFTSGETVPGISTERDLVHHLLPGISLAEVNAAIGAFLGPGSRLVTVTMPEKKGLQPPTEARLAAVVDGVMSNAALTPYQDVVAEGPLVAEAPAPGQVVSEVKNTVLDTTEWILSNGVRVVLKSTAFQDSQVQFEGWRWGGVSQAVDADFVSASSAISIAAQSGVGTFDNVTLPKRLVGKEAYARLGIGPLSVTLSGGAATADLETMFELLWLNATAPRLDEAAYARFRANFADALKNRNAQPETAFYDTFNRLLWGDHFRTRPWTVETLQQMDLAKARTFVAEQTAHWTGATFVFVGDIDPVVFKPLIAQWIGALPTRSGVVPAYRDVGQRMAPGVHVETVSRGLAAKASAAIRIHGDFESTPRNRYALRSLTRVLQMRLREVLREEKGGTYSAGASVRLQHHPVQTYGVDINFSCEPARVQELTDATWRIIRDLKDAPVEAGYAQKVAAQQAREDELEKRDNGYWQGVLVSNLRRGETPEDLLTYWALHKTLTPAVIHDAAKRFLDLERYVQVTLLPAETSSTPE